MTPKLIMPNTCCSIGAQYSTTNNVVKTELRIRTHRLNSEGSMMRWITTALCQPKAKVAETSLFCMLCRPRCCGVDIVGTLNDLRMEKRDLPKPSTASVSLICPLARQHDRSFVQH